MKKIISIFLSFSIVFLSVSTCIPISVCADTDKTVLSKSSDSPFGYSSSEAQKYVSAHLDIYDSDNTLLFSYTPTSTYNWTYSAKGKDNLHLSDNQLKAFLMSKKTLSAYAQLMLSGFSNNNVTRGFLSALGIATTGNSNALTDVSDKLLGNYNYLDAIDYNEDTQTIIMSNDNSAVDKLKEEIKIYYMKSIGASYLYHSFNYNNIAPAKAIENIHSSYQYEEDYVSDFNAVNQYDYSISTASNNIVLAFDKNFSYAYKDDSKKFYNWDKNYALYFTDSSANIVIPEYHLFNPSDNDVNLSSVSPNCSVWSGSGYNGIWAYFDIEVSDNSGNKLSATHYHQGTNYFFTNKNVNDTFVFNSYSALFNYVSGDQNAYLSSQIHQTGLDLQFSINNMSQNFTEQMDKLIDNLNENKSSMTADELQNAIDKGIENLNKNTEDIKDNTSDILDVLREQNQILLDILGVTTNIYKVVKESDSKEKTYNINYVQSVFNSMFKGLKNAVLYGENTVRDDVSEDTDDIDSIVSDIPPDKKNYHNGLFGRFPFSVPYQLFDWLQALYVEPVAPKFTLSYAYLFKDLGYETNNFEFIIDLGDEKYSKWIELVRSGEKLSFIIYMAIATYHRFKNEI